MCNLQDLPAKTCCIQSKNILLCSCSPEVSGSCSSGGTNKDQYSEDRNSGESPCYGSGVFDKEIASGACL